MTTGPENNDMVIELEAVDVLALASPRLVAIRQVDWQVRQGERWLISGAARTGKSSVVGVAAGLVRPASGRHLLFGRDMAQLNESDRTALRLRVGVVFGGGGRLFPMLNVLQNLTMPLLYHLGNSGLEDAEFVKRVLSVFELEPFAHWWPADLPRWAAQRVALARALVLRPSVLLLDEPTLGLPAEETTWWQQFLSGGGVDALGQACMPTTWILAATEPRTWEHWAGRHAQIAAGRWEVTGVAPRIASFSE